ncbi:MAG: hypothetical protein J6W70_04090, partial [Lentisphaeria bacterium]|nr:hypothetical protein [Lentisphaeria bacterium]
RADERSAFFETAGRPETLTRTRRAAGTQKSRMFFRPVPPHFRKKTYVRLIVADSGCILNQT